MGRADIESEVRMHRQRHDTWGELRAEMRKRQGVRGNTKRCRDTSAPPVEWELTSKETRGNMTNMTNMTNTAIGRFITYELADHQSS